MMARPLITTLGGTCCSPSALRNRLSTTTSLVNEVTMTATKGASARLTTVTRISAGLRLPKSIGVDRQKLHSECIAGGDELTVPDRRTVGSDDDARVLEPRREFEHIAWLEGRKLSQR